MSEAPTVGDRSRVPGGLSVYEFEALIVRMNRARDLLYSMAQTAGWSPLVAFVGLLSKYIELAERAYKESGEFIKLPMTADDVEYLLEKLNLIFGPSAAITMVPRQR
jgi:hypothetical protein